MIVKPRKTSPSTATTANPRYVPAVLKREIFKRDNSACVYRHRDGSICGSKWQLEIDHIMPIALGGKTEKKNLRLLCRAHNQKAAKDAGL